MVGIGHEDKEKGWRKEEERLANRQTAKTFFFAIDIMFSDVLFWF